MPNTQTTGVDIVVKARSVQARAELRALRNDVKDFGEFTRDTFKGISVKQIDPPKLSDKWKTTEKEIATITASIKRNIQSLNGIRNNAVLVSSGRGSGAGGASGGASAIKREADEAARLTREYRAGIITLTEYQQKLQQTASQAKQGSDQQLNALIKLRGVEKEITAERDKRNKQDRPASLAEETAEVNRLNREYRAGVITLTEYDRALQKISTDAERGSEKQLAALARVRQAEQTGIRNNLQRLQIGGQFMRDAGGALTAGVTAPAVAAAGYALNVTVKSDEAFNEVRRFVDGTKEELDGLQKDLRKLSLDPKIGQSFEELAKSASFGGQLGIARKDIVEFTRQVAYLGQSGDLSGEQAATGIAKIAAAMQVNMKELPRMSSALAQMGQEGASTLSEILNMSQRFAPVAKQVGASVPQIFAFSNALASTGVQAEIGGTALQRFFSVMQISTATGGAKLKEFATIAGMTSEQFKKAFQEDAVKASLAFLEGLDKIPPKSGKALIALHDLQLDSRGLRTAILNLASSHDFLIHILEQSQKAYEGQNVAEQKAGIASQSYARQLKQLRNEAEGIAADVGPALAQSLIDLLKLLTPVEKSVKGAAEAFNSMGKEEQQMVIQTVAAAGSIGPILFTIGNIILKITEYRRDLLELKEAQLALNGIQPATAEAIGGTTGAVNLLTTGVGGLLVKLGLIAVLLYELKVAFDLVKGAIHDLNEEEKAYEGLANVAPRSIHAAAANKDRSLLATQAQLRKNYTTTQKTTPKTIDEDQAKNNAQVEYVAWLQARASEYFGRQYDYGYLESHPKELADLDKEVDAELNRRLTGSEKLAGGVPGAKAPPPKKTPPGKVPDIGAGDRHISPADVSRVPEMKLAGQVKDIESQYSVALSELSDSADTITKGDLPEAQKGLIHLANQIYATEQKLAAEKLKEVNQAEEHNKGEATRLKANAKNQQDTDRANDIIAKANMREAEAQATYDGEIEDARRNHADKFRSINKTIEDLQKKLAEQEAKNIEQRGEQQAKALEEQASAIDDQINRTEDADKKRDLLEKKFQALRDAAVVRLQTAQNKTVLGVIDNTTERGRTSAKAQATYDSEIGKIERDRTSAGLENDQFRLESEIKVHETQMKNTDDLIAKLQLLKRVQAETIDLMVKRGATDREIEATKAEQARDLRQQQAEIAKRNVQSTLIQAATQGTVSFDFQQSLMGNYVGRGTNGEAFRQQLRAAMKEQYENTELPQRGAVAKEQFDTLTKAVETGSIALQDILPLLADMEKRITESGDIGAANEFYAALKRFFELQIAPMLQDADQTKKGPAREAAYNDLIAGVRSGKQFAGLSERERGVVIGAIQERRDKKDDSDQVKYHTGIERIADDTAKAITQEADRHAGDFIGIIFGKKDKAKQAARDFWQSVAETGQQSLAHVANELLLKPIGKQITQGLSGVFSSGASQIEGALMRSLGSFDAIFKRGAFSILQTAVYLEGVLALAGKQGGRRGKKGGILGAVAGVGLGLATGGAGLALVGAGLTGASFGSNVAQGNYLGAGLSLLGGFSPGGAFAGHAAGAASGAAGLGSGAYNSFGGGGMPALQSLGKAGGGGVAKGVGFIGNEDFGTHGPEMFVPSSDGLIIPSAVAVSRLPTVAAANNQLLKNLLQMSARGGLGRGDEYNFNDYGDKYTEVDGARTLRKFSKDLRDSMNRKA